jgi:ATP-dependent protease ClpP protease subunit
MKTINLEATRNLTPPPTLAPGVIRLNKKDDQAEVFIYGDIGGWLDGIDAETFAKELAEMDVKQLDVRINSGGGYVFDGIAIYNAIARHPAHTTMHIEGIAASIASVIPMAGDEIKIYEGTRMMIHKPWSFAIGDADAMRKEGDILDALQSDILDLYEARTGKERKDLTKWMDAETWFSAKEAVDKGFADEMVPAKKKAMARSAYLNYYRNKPEDLQPDDDLPDVREFEQLLRDGEGLSIAQSKRIAALSKKQFALREVEPDDQRDVGVDPEVAALMRQNINDLYLYTGELK